jgi:hypothetical protein
MANKLEPSNLYLEIGAAMDAGRQRAMARRQEEEANALAQAVRAASARAVRNGMVDPRLLGEELAQSGYAYAIPGAQEKLFATEKAAGEAAEATGKGKSAGTKALGDKLQLFRERLPVNNPRLLPAWVESVYADPEVGSFMSQFGSKEDVIAGIPKDDPVKLNEWMEAASMLPSEYMKRISTTAAEELTAATTRRGQDIQAATARRGQDIERDVKERQQNLETFFGGGKGGKEAAKEVAGAEAFEGVIGEMETAYDQLDRMAAIPSTKRSAAENLAISLRTSGAGQMAGRAAGTPEQSVRNEIQSARLRLLQGIKAATGMSAQELNSNVELQQWLDSVTNPANDVESNRKILNSIRTFVARRSGKQVPAAPPAAAPTQAPATGGRKTQGGTSYEIIGD